MNDDAGDLKESILTIQVNVDQSEDHGDHNSGGIKSLKYSSSGVLQENSVASPTQRNHNSDPIMETSLAF